MQPHAIQPHADVNVQSDHPKQTLKPIKNNATNSKPQSTRNLSKQKNSLDTTKHTIINLAEPTHTHLNLPQTSLI